MFGLRSQKPDPTLTKVALVLERLEGAMEAAGDGKPDSETTSIQLVERVDSLENRFEELRGTVLRHLQSASQRLKKVQDLSDDLDDEQPQTLPIPFDQGPEAEVSGPENDLAWAADQMRKNGISPIT
jgi:hypothetical protein